MKPTDRELRYQRVAAAEKNAHAIIARDFSASRMNATKWREVIESLEDIEPNYRFQWIWDTDVSEWMNIWIPYPHSNYFDTAQAGPFRTFIIEWLEIDPRGHEAANEVALRLDKIGVPRTQEGGYIRIVGYVRNT